MDVLECRYLAFDGTPLFYRRISPDSPVATTLLIIHGMGEHGGRYVDFARAMAGAGIECVVPDLRGFGRSSGRRGDARRLTDFLRDLAGFYRFVSRSSANRPVFVLGHSFGGFLACRLLDVASDVKPRGTILTSPLVRPAILVPAWKNVIAAVASAVWPGYSEKIPLDARLLTHDAAILARDVKDPLLDYKISARLYTALRRSLATFPTLARRLRCPMLVLQAGEDHVVSRSATESFFNQLGSQDKEWVLYPGLYHEILNEIDRPLIYSKIASWIISRAK